MDKISKSKEILSLAAEMSDHYYHKPIIICYSGGKDSDVILRLAMETLRPDQFEVLHSITTVDSPVTNKYVNDVFKELKEKVSSVRSQFHSGQMVSPLICGSSYLKRKCPRQGLSDIAVRL